MINGTLTDHYGTILHYQDDLLHREDGPAIERENGDKIWMKHGRIHNDNGPAITHVEGSEFYYLNGKCHREDGPAIIYASGEQFFYLDGKHLSSVTSTNELIIRMIIE